MAAIDQRLARKGRGESRLGLVRQGGYTRSTVKSYLQELLENGLRPTYTTELDEAILAVENYSSSKKVVRDNASALYREALGVHRKGKALKRRTYNAVKLVLVENDESKLNISMFKVGKAEATTRTLAAYLNDIAPHVKILDERLKPYFKGASAYEQLVAVKNELVVADEAQDEAFKKAPLETLAYYEAKGRLLELIEYANGVARLAFDGRAEVLALFNKDLLLRASRTKSKSGEGQDEQGSDDDETTDPGAEQVPA